jgi:DNA topoisomerase-3
MKEIRAITRHIIDQIRNFENEQVHVEAGFSPVDGMKIFSTPTAWVSEDNSKSIRKILGGKLLPEEDIVALLQGKTIGPYSDFRSKKGKPFSASVRFVDNKVEFLFADSNSDLDIKAIKSGESLGKSPVDDTDVYTAPMAYMSESALDDSEDKNGLRISRIILSREIEAKHIRQLLSDGKTELINGFISKKRRPFDAYLLLSKSGKVSFEFPPRKPRQKK